MKLNKKLFLTFLFSIVIFILFDSYHVTVQAAFKPTIATSFPKAMRGYWYASDGKTKYYIGKKVFEYKNGKHVQKSYLHNSNQQKKYPMGSDSSSKKSPTVNWLYAYQGKYHGMNWIDTIVWNAGAGDGAFYNFSKHNGHQVLSTAYGAGVWGTQHYYRSFKLAKQFMHKRYPHYSYIEEE
ncbi:hypothetical protein [Apilactobacillus micheneri]|uniref:hypothetical protein n=1 Tax=Apilactobacillus micheneri TaxID=1899430 RepID=UPI0011260DD3|nr:hypothetical protein [Apilactobacillus micheneri]TPR52531.1 hypothetical protein DY126_01690 [Apilactobacillus micheneri]